ncbi:MAG: ABC transporter ATP-binding protein [Verrucomicrobia bacterium]|nr:ABC transporter ATP-binding protein [Verrucomicrobiota bacterium]
MIRRSARGIQREKRGRHNVSSQTVIRVEKLSKAYTIWSSPAARVHGPVLGRIGRLPFLPSGARRLCSRLSHESFRNFYALRDISFTVRKGESVGIIGLNGSGKSTLLQMIAGTLEPTEGSVEVNGRIAALLELGSGFNPEFTGRENVFLGATILGLSRQEIEARFQQIADFSEIGEFIEQPVKTYSSGMQVRLAFSVTTAIVPDILIVDEALSVGDAYFQHKCFSQIRKFREQGTTLLFVSHDPGAVKSLCNRAILLDAGRAIRDDAPDAALDYYNAMIARREANHAIEQVESATGRKATRSGNKKAFASAVDLLQDGRTVRALTVGSRATFRVCVKAHEPLEQLTLGILLRDRFGNDVFGTNTFHMGIALNPRPGRVLVVDFNVPELHLGAGHYSLTTSLHSSDTHLADNYDWWDQALVFQVVPGPQPKFIGTCCLPVEVTTRDEAAAP